MRQKNLLLFSLFLLLTSSSSAQSDWYNQQWTKEKVNLEIKKLLNPHKILYIAAHPDDENTRLISYFENVKHIDVAYLSLTNGSGGQNLIGTELGEELGSIREQELLAARRHDGADQLFSSAQDFGYSKTHTETFEKWNKYQILGEVVFLIRSYQPDIIITRFSPSTVGLNPTHGHHTASAILAQEAFKLAADENSYPEQLSTLKTWQTKAIYWNSSFWSYGSREKLEAEFKRNPLRFTKLNTEAYIPELGLTNSEIASNSRSMHKSQGFGTMPSYGENLEYLEFLAGDKSYFAKIQDPVMDVLTPSNDYLNEALYAQNNDRLIYLKKAIEAAEKEGASRLQLDQIKRLYLNSARVRCFITANYHFIPKGTNKLSLDFTHFNSQSMYVSAIESDANTIEINQRVVPGVSLKREIELQYPQAYKPAFATITIDGIRIELPVVFRTSDPVKGEIIQSVEVTQSVVFEIKNKVQTSVYSTQEKPKDLSVNVHFLKEYKSLDFEMGSFLKSQLIVPAETSFNANSAIDLSIPLTSNNSGNLSLTATSHSLLKKRKEEPEIKDVIDTTITQIKYDHIPWIYKIEPASYTINRVQVVCDAKKVGYVIGAGDKIPEAIEAMGCLVEIVDYQLVTAEQLLKYDAIVFGIRALNVLHDIDQHLSKFYEYAEAGGTLVMQYNTSHQLKTANIQSLELSRDRVTNEKAPVTILNNHKILNQPNKISVNDWNLWVQERGLYFPNKWDSSFTPVLGMADQGEQQKQGSLLIKQMGDGYFVYTGLSFFRELPAGVEGAYKLWANILSL